MASQLLFNFSDINSDNFIAFANVNFPQYEWCIEASPNTCAAGPPAGAEQVNFFTLSGVGDITQFESLSGTQVIGSTVPEPTALTIMVVRVVGITIARRRGRVSRN
jgi:hypothetical protein